MNASRGDSAQLNARCTVEGAWGGWRWDARRARNTSLARYQRCDTSGMKV